MPTNTPSTAALVVSALHDADDVSGRIHAGGYRANLSDTEHLRNHVRRLANRLEALSSPPPDVAELVAAWANLCSIHANLTDARKTREATGAAIAASDLMELGTRLAAALERLSVQPPTADVEAVARIIDHEAFDDFEVTWRDSISRGKDPAAVARLYPLTTDAMKAALAKARTILALRTPAPVVDSGNENQDITDLAIMLRRLCHIIKTEAPNSRFERAVVLADKAIDLLLRKGLQGSLLRSSTSAGEPLPETAPHPSPFIEGWMTDQVNAGRRSIADNSREYGDGTIVVTANAVPPQSEQAAEAATEAWPDSYVPGDVILSGNQFRAMVDEGERLRELLREANTVLQPFAEDARSIHAGWDDKRRRSTLTQDNPLLIAHFRAANTLAARIKSVLASTDVEGSALND